MRFGMLRCRKSPTNVHTPGLLYKTEATSNKGIATNMLADQVLIRWKDHTLDAMCGHAKAKAEQICKCSEMMWR